MTIKPYFYFFGILILGICGIGTIYNFMDSTKLTEGVYDSLTEEWILMLTTGLGSLILSVVMIIDFMVLKKFQKAEIFPQTQLVRIFQSFFVRNNLNRHFLADERTQEDSKCRI